MNTINQNISSHEIETWLRETNPEKLELLWSTADNVRKKYVGDVVHFRGLLEISNYCRRECTYCGINRNQNTVSRYRMTADEIIAGALVIDEFGYGTVVMQSGEDYGLTKEFITNVIREIKQRTSLAVTLSLSERSLEEMREWKAAGADRYLLRFETSDPELYQLIHPALNNNELPMQRLQILKELRAIGYEVGSGVMVGIPGQTYKILSNDITLFRSLDLDMIGVGPYLPDLNTALGKNLVPIPNVGDKQVPATELMTYKVIALIRIVCPEANIPSTTALATINRVDGRELGLMRGANIVMPNMTPTQYREKYSIYPNKIGVDETAKTTATNLQKRIEKIGRYIGQGHGGRNSES